MYFLLMAIILEFLFHLRIIYKLIDVQSALFIKYKLKIIISHLLKIFFLLFLLYVRNFYITFILISCFFFVQMDLESSNRGLIYQLHEAGTFGNWKSTKRIVQIVLWGIIFYHFFLGPSLFESTKKIFTFS